MSEQPPPGSRDGPEDLLGHLIRTAGRRSSPPDAHTERTLAAARLAWQGAVRRRRSRHLAFGAAAGIAALAAVFQLLLPRLSMPSSIASVERVAGLAHARATESAPWMQLAAGGGRSARASKCRPSLALASHCGSVPARRCGWRPRLAWCCVPRHRGAAAGRTRVCGQRRRSGRCAGHDRQPWWQCAGGGHAVRIRLRPGGVRGAVAGA